MPAAPGVDVEVRAGRPRRAVTCPEPGRRKPRTTSSSVDLPHPLGPVSATTSPGSTTRSAPCSAGDPAAGIGDLEAVDADARVLGPLGRAGTGAAPADGVSRSSKTCSAASSRRRWRGSWRRAPAVAGTPRAPGRARRGRRGSPCRPSSSRRPTATATSATETVASSSSMSDERKVSSRVAMRGRAVSIGDVCDGAGLRLRPAEDLQGGEAPRRRRGSGRRVVAATACGLRCDPRRQADQAHEDGDERHLTAISTAEMGSAPATTPMMVTGTITARKSWGR